VILADTDALIDYLSDISPVAEQVAQYAQADRLWTTAVTCFELLTSADEGKRGDKVRELVQAINVLLLDLPAAQRAAGVRRHLESTGQAIGMADSLIAGTALLHDLPLLTRNRNHFERVPGLSLVQDAGARARRR
jgi:tRNA(fMet)-specific endonuclease VapC